MVVVAPRSQAIRGIGRDQVVGLEAALFEAGQVERAHRVADQRELRDQIVRRRRPVRLVVGIELVAERDLGLVEDDRQMRRPVVLGHVAQQLPQHVAEAEHGIDLQPVGFAVQRRQRVIGAENVGGTVDQKDMVALARNFGGRLGFAALVWRLGLSGRLAAALAGAGLAALGAVFGMAEILGIFARIDSLGGRFSTLSSAAISGRVTAGEDLLRRLQRRARPFFGAIQNASGRSNRKLACSASASRQIASAPTTPATVTISETVPMSRSPLRSSSVRVAAIGRKKAR